MALTPQELDAIGKAFADRLKNTFFGDNSFSGNSARKSRNSENTESGTFIEDLDKMMAGGFDKTFKRWYDSSREMTRVLKGSALRDAHDYLVDSLDEISSKSNQLAKSIAESYSDIVKANKGNHQLQQRIHTAMESYTVKLKRLDKMTSGDEKTQDDETKQSIKDLRKEVNDAADELNQLGINASKIKLAWNGHRFKQLDASTKEIINTNEKILSANKEYVDDLTKLHARELEARDSMIKSLAAVSFKSVTKAIGETIRVADSRLRNLQSATEWTEAIMNGMSPQQMNEWQNANRLAKSLMGEASDDFYEGTKGVLHEFGYFGNELKQMQTKMASTLINSGIKPSQKAGEEFMNVVGRLQAIEGVSRDEAVQLASDALQSPYYMINALNKSQDERIELMTSQLVESRKISKGIGLSNRFLQSQEQEGVNNRYQDVISKITKSAMTDAFIAEVENKLGRKLTGEERELVRAERGDALTPDEAQRYNTGIGKEIRTLFSDAAAQSSKDFRSGDFSKSLGNVAFEVMATKAGYDRAGLAQAQDEATVVQGTRGEAIKNLDDKAVVKESRESLSAIEEYTRIIQETLTGWGANPIGAAVNSIGKLMVAYVGGKLLMGIGSTALKNVLQHGAKGAAVRGGQVALGAAKTAGRGIGAAGLLAGGAVTGTLIGAYKGLNTSTEDYAKRMGLENAPTTLAGTTAVRTAGVMADVGEGLSSVFTLGMGDSNTILKAMTHGHVDKDKLDEITTKLVDLKYSAQNKREDAKNALLNQIIQNKAQLNPIQYSDALRAFSAGDYETASKLGSLTKSMASGEVIDENGNPVNSENSVWNKILDVLNGIEENTQETAGEVAKGNEQYKDTETAKLTQSAYSSKIKDNVQSMLQQRMGGMKGAADAAISNGYASIDRAFGAA